MKITRKQLLQIVREQLSLHEERFLDGPEVDIEYMVKTFLTDEQVPFEATYSQSDFLKDWPLSDPNSAEMQDISQGDMEMMALELPGFEHQDIIAVIRNQKPSGAQWRKIKRVVKKVNRQIGETVVLLAQKPCYGFGESAGILTNILACRNSPDTVFIVRRS